MTGSVKQSIAPAVIASEAKQSIAPRKERMDCFAALAMTEGERRHETALPRHRPSTGRASARPMTGAVKQSIAPAVIASEAKQSIAPQQERMDCFAALAMTEGERWHETALPRHRPPTGRASARPMTGAVKQSIAPAVIASAAKQSIAPQQERMDCFAALAMTWSSRHVFTTSPRIRADPLARND